MEFDNPRIIDSNGTKYKAGWDAYGWFTIGRVECNPTVAYDEATPDDFELVGDGWTSFTPDGAQELKEAIEEGL